MKSVNIVSWYPASQKVEQTKEIGVEEAEDLTLGLSESFILDDGLVEPAPKGSSNKFHSWLSYFYSSTKRSVTSSPVSTPESPDHLEEIGVLLARKPIKGILKKSKPIDPNVVPPPPVQKALFLRNEELSRLSRFTVRHLRHHRHCSLVKYTPARIRFDLEKIQYASTYGKEEYDRGKVEYVAKCLTICYSYPLQKT